MLRLRPLKHGPTELVEDRIRYLEAFREEVQSHREEMAEAICMETGKPRWEALTEVDAIAGKIGVSV